MHACNIPALVELSLGQRNWLPPVVREGGIEFDATHMVGSEAERSMEKDVGRESHV
jgi:hypothetical protein